MREPELNRKKMTSIRLLDGEYLIARTATGDESFFLAYPGDLLIAAISNEEIPPEGWYPIGPPAMA